MYHASRRTLGVAILGTVFGTVAAVIPATSAGAAGRPAPAQISFGVASHDYGSVTTGQSKAQEFTLTNSGGKSAGGLSVGISGTGFTITSNGCGKSLRPNATCSVTVTFAPTSAGAATGTLTASARGITSATVSLTGSGTPPAADRYLYWVSSTDVGRAQLDGTSPNGQFVAGEQSPMAIDVGAGYVYWAVTGDILRIPVSGTGSPETVVSTTDEVLGVAVADPYVYWTNYDAKEIWRANLDGTSPEALLTGLDNPTGLDVADGYLYWSEYSGASTSKILRISLSDLTGTPEVLYEYAADSPSGPAGLEVGAGRVYWADTNWTNYAGSVLSVPVGGGTSRVDVSLSAPIRIDDIALDVTGGWLYYTANNDTYPATSSIQRRLLNGTGSAETIESDLWLVYGLAVG